MFKALSQTHLADLEFYLLLEKPSPGFQFGLVLELRVFKVSKL